MWPAGASRPVSALPARSVPCLIARSPTLARQAAARSTGGDALGGTDAKMVWLSTSSQAALTAALEAGVDTVVFEEEQLALAEEWQQLGRFQAVTRTADGRLVDGDGEQVGRVRLLACPEDLRAAEREAAAARGVVVMDAADWQVIPAENLVAAYQHNPRASLMAAADDCQGGRVMLEALEAGAAGVLLRTDSPAEVRALMRYVAERAEAGAPRLRYAAAAVTAVTPVGMGDRACVDLACLLGPGEGLLVGSFARCLAMVHSECGDSRYISSRPFRVNAGPVHAYVAAPGGRTAYLSELRAGSEVLVADAQGRTRAALVGRVKIERRPLVLVEAELPDGDTCSLLLQNAETVRLVCPTASSQDGSGSTPGSGGDSDAGPGWAAVSVSELAPGQRFLVLQQGAARHTGVAIEESITER